MSDINSSLIGFLKKKSLFSNSPEKTGRRNSKSQEKQLVMTPSIKKHNLAQTTRELDTQSSKNLHRSSQRHFEEYEPEGEYEKRSLMQESPIRYDHQVKDRPRRNFNLKKPSTSTKQIKFEEKKPEPNVWAGLVNHATSFESARLESAQCLDTLSSKLHAEISGINYKIDMFNSKMNKVLAEEFKNLEEKIYSIVNRVFAESENTIRLYIKQQEEILAGELITMRQSLQKELQKVEYMREQIKKPNWRKVAGELLSTELETKVEDMLRISKGVDIGVWEIGDLGTNKVSALQDQLREIITLTNS